MPLLRWTWVMPTASWASACQSVLSSSGPFFHAPSSTSCALNAKPRSSRSWAEARASSGGRTRSSGMGGTPSAPAEVVDRERRGDDRFGAGQIRRDHAQPRVHHVIDGDSVTATARPADREVVIGSATWQVRGNGSAPPAQKRRAAEKMRASQPVQGHPRRAAAAGSFAATSCSASSPSGSSRADLRLTPPGRSGHTRARRRRRGRAGHGSPHRRASTWSGAGARR